MKVGVEKYIGIILKNSLISFSILFIFLIGLYPGISNFQLDASSDSLVLENDPDLKTYREMGNLFSDSDFLIEEIYISNPVWLELFLYLLKIKPKQDSIPDIIIGAGSKTTIPMLRHKIHSKTKVISVMKPQFFESKFDLIVAPRHDYKVVPNNVFTYIGSIAKVNINPELEDIGLLLLED